VQKIALQEIAKMIGGCQAFEEALENAQKLLENDSALLVVEMGFFSVFSISSSMRRSSFMRRPMVPGIVSKILRVPLIDTNSAR